MGMFNRRPLLFAVTLFVCHSATCSVSGTQSQRSVVSSLISSRLSATEDNSLFVPYMPGGGFDMSHHEALLGERAMEVISIPPGYQLEENFDWALNRSVVGAALNQGGCGSCWAFSSAGAVASSLAINTGYVPIGGEGGGDFEISEQQLLDCAPNPNNCGGTGGCEGSTQALGLKYWTENGFDLVGDGVDGSNDEYLGKDEKCAQNKTTRPGVLQGWGAVANNDMESLMFAVREFGPVAVSVDAGAISKNYKGGIVSYNECGANLDHAVLLVGYGCESGTDGSEEGKAHNCWFKIRNSWGPTWGECRDGSTNCANDDKGYFRISRQSLEENSQSSLSKCAMDTSTEDGLGCIGADKKIKPRNAQVCGTCGVLYNPVVPIGAHFIDGFKPHRPVQAPDNDCAQKGQILDEESCNAQGCGCKINPDLSLDDCVQGGALEACVMGETADQLSRYCFGKSDTGAPGCDAETGKLASTGVYGRCAEGSACKVCFPNSPCGTSNKWLVH